MFNFGLSFSSIHSMLLKKRTRKIQVICTALLLKKVSYVMDRILFNWKVERKAKPNNKTSWILIT